MAAKTKLEKRMQEVAQLTGCIVHVGKYPHNDDWYAHVDGVEWQAPTALKALDAVIVGLMERAVKTAAAVRKVERLAKVQQ